MTKTNPTDNLRLPKSEDYWYDIITGGLFTAGYLIFIGSLILKKADLNFWFYPYAIFCIVIVVYYQWSDDKLVSIKTGLSKEENYALTTICLDTLDWQYDKKTTRVELTLNKYILKFLRPTIIPENDNIYFNFKYHSPSPIGRLPFFFGISTYLEWKFKTVVRKQLLQTVHYDT